MSENILKCDQAPLVDLREPCLTIITINRNNGRFLQRTLDSLTKFRDDRRVECLFVDGASTDCSLDVAAGFYDLRKIVSEPDSGIYNAMNKGLRRAKGKYLLWLNSGDELKTCAHATVMPILAAGTADLISFGLEMFREGAGTPEIIWRPKTEDLPHHTLPHPTTFFNRLSLISVFGYCESYKIAGDRDAILKMYYFRRALEIHEEIIGIFYFGGVSSGYALAYDNLLIDRNYGLINVAEYLIKFTKLKVKEFLK